MIPASEKDFVYTAIGAQIKRVREGKPNFTQEKLANAVGLSRTSIVNIENGKQKFLLHTFFDIASALSVEPKELIPGGMNNLASRTNLPHGISAELRTWIEHIVSN